MKHAKEWVRTFNCNHFQAPRFASGCGTCLRAVIVAAQVNALNDAAGLAADVLLKTPAETAMGIAEAIEELARQVKQTG